MIFLTGNSSELWLPYKVDNKLLHDPVLPMPHIDDNTDW